MPEAGRQFLVPGREFLAEDLVGRSLVPAVQELVCPCGNATAALGTGPAPSSWLLGGVRSGAPHSQTRRVLAEGGLRGQARRGSRRWLEGQLRFRMPSSGVGARGAVPVPPSVLHVADHAGRCVWPSTGAGTARCMTHSATAACWTVSGGLRVPAAAQSACLTRGFSQPYRRGGFLPEAAQANYGFRNFCTTTVAPAIDEPLQLYGYWTSSLVMATDQGSIAWGRMKSFMRLSRRSSPDMAVIRFTRAS